MTIQITKRNATHDELNLLGEYLTKLPTSTQRWKQVIENTFVVWCASFLILIAVWLILAWLGRAMFQVEFGLHSATTSWYLSVSAIVCAVYAVVSTNRWIKGWKDSRSLLRSDILNAQIVEERYFFNAVKRFQEPEHGGLVYFLRAVSGKVFVLYDEESQDLGAQGHDPLTSSFVPKCGLLLARAPASKFVISKAFSGEVLTIGDTFPLGIAPEEWPEPDAICDIPWTKLENRLCPKGASDVRDS